MSRPRLLAAASALERSAPWVLPVIFLLWGWRVRDLFGAIPTYGDVFEQLWGLQWFGDRLLAGQQVAFFPGIFHPLGFQVGSFSNSPATFIALIPLYKLAGAAFTFNLATLSCFVVAYAGMYFLARQMKMSRLLAALVATLFAFCGYRWLRVGGHLNQLIGSSLFPWILLAVERAWESRRGLLWFALAGLLWGVAAAASFYFIWFGAIAVGVMVLVKALTNEARWRQAFFGFTVSCLVALVCSGPVLWVYFNASTQAHVAPSDIGWVTAWGVNLNSLPLINVNHPIDWLRNVSRSLYTGPLDESGTANLGIVATLLAVVGLWLARKDRRWWPLLWVTGLGLLLALGYILRWNGQAVEWPFKGVNSAIWAIGHRLKSDFFRPAEPYGPLVEGVTLPSLLLAAVLPFWEGARTLARFVLMALPGFYLLVGRGIQGFHRPALRVALALLLLIEIIPLPSGTVAASPAPHPAFEWLRTNTQPGEGIVDLAPAGTERLDLMFSGAVLWATQHHERPTAAGTGSVWPAHTDYLRGWFITHPRPGSDPELIPTLQGYGIRSVLLHMKGPDARAVLEELQAAPGIEFVNCFARAKQQTVWPNDICILRVSLPAADSRIAVTPREGWSSSESWGIWATGLESKARWLTLVPGKQRLSVEAFPQCAPGRNQRVLITVNGSPVGEHQWQGCDPWAAEIEIPAEAVSVGWNDLIFHYDYAAAPVDVTRGKNADPRPLSVGFTRLSVAPVQP